MKLLDLTEELTGSPEMRGLINKQMKLRSEMDQLKRRAASGIQGGINPAYKDQVARLKSALAAVGAEIQHVQTKPDIEQEQRGWQDKFAQIRQNYSDEDRKASFGQAVSNGFDRWRQLRADAGGDDALDGQIKQVAAKMTQDGIDLLNVEQLAKHFGVPSRTMYKRLERPSLVSLRRWMPREQ